MYESTVRLESGVMNEDVVRVWLESLDRRRLGQLDTVVWREIRLRNRGVEALPIGGDSVQLDGK